MRTLNNTEIASVNGGFLCLFGLFFFKPAFSFSFSAPKPVVCAPQPVVCPQPAPQPAPCAPAPRPSRGGC